MGLIGYPLEHSLSPDLHTAALTDAHLDGEYKLYPIRFDENLEDRLKKILRKVREGSIIGLNVTIPYKTTVIEYLDELTDTARLTGAVNTIYLHNNNLYGDNTDVNGFLNDLDKFINALPDEADPRSLAERTALVLGAGGASRAVVYGLIKTGWNVTIAARIIRKSNLIAHSITNFVGKKVVNSIELSVIGINSLQQPIHLLVNATSAGMRPEVNRSPWITGKKLPDKTLVYDLVYNPRDTLLVKQARKQGLFATSGFGMLVEQAALAFQRWTGYLPSLNVMRKAVDIGSGGEQ